MQSFEREPAVTRSTGMGVSDMSGTEKTTTQADVLEADLTSAASTMSSAAPGTVPSVESGEQLGDALVESSNTGSASVNGPHTRRIFRSERLLAPLVFVLVVALWSAAVSWFKVPAYILPSPAAIWKALLRNLADATFYQDAGVTCAEVLLGYLFGALVAVALGGLIAEICVLKKALLPYVIALQAVPAITLAPIFVMWFGYGQLSKIAMSALVSSFPIVMATITGLNGYPDEQARMIRAFGGGRWQVFRRVKVPNALPYIFSGLKTGMLLALVGAIVGEFIGAKTGLGARILLYNYQFNIAGSYAVIIVLAVIGLALTWLIAFAQSRVVFWTRHRSDGVK
jgi:NitT/TauT family transport system permease protein